MPAQCRWCGREFQEPPIIKSKAKTQTVKRSAEMECADHEWKCEENPNHPAAEKVSKAWSPRPWPVSDFGGARPQPKPDRIVFLEGPWHGREQHWDAHLINGTVVTIEPPRIIPGPTVSDSKDRRCSLYMGHYELRLALVGDEKIWCPVYRWVATITPKKRLTQPRTFNEAWPALAVTLEMEEANAGTTDGIGDGADQVSDPAQLGLQQGDDD